MSTSDSYDYWTDEAGTPTEESGVHLTVETITDAEPLDDQFGVDQVKTVPDPLLVAIFGQPEANDELARERPVNTYALLDAAKVQSLPELLEASGLEHRCLFKGKAYNELKSVAPWIVRLEEGNTFTRNLFTRSAAPWHLWDTEPGLYLRSRGTLDQLLQHLRKFTRVRDEAEKWFYFRFWETGCLIDYISFAQKNDHGDLRPLFGFDPVNKTEPLVHAYVSVGRDETKTCSVSRMLGHNAKMRTQIDMTILRFLALRSHAHEFAESYFEGQGTPASVNQLKQAKDIATHIAQKYHSFGFKSRYHLGSFTYWALTLNADFETRTQLIHDHIHRKNENPNDRFVAISREMKGLFGPKIRNYHGHGT